VKSLDVAIHSLWIRKDRRKPYTVRWKVANKPHAKAFVTRGLADNYRSNLMQAARRGEEFDVATGLPPSMEEKHPGVTWYDHACRYVDVKWPKAAGKTRSSTADALATVTAALLKDAVGKPDDRVLRKALVGWAFNKGKRDTERPGDVAEALAWVERHSQPLGVFDDVSERLRVTRGALDACTLTLDGKAAAATTGRRKRAVLYNALGYAVELGELRSNPIDAVQWKVTKVAEEVDRRVVASPAQVRELLTAVSYVGRWNGERLVAFFALLYFAALRPSEALALRRQDCELPKEGWGRLTLVSSEPEVGKAWSDDGERTESRSLKWRARKEVRVVPIPPELVKILRTHLKRFGAASDGRLFRTTSGGYYTRSAYYRVWQEARTYAVSPAVADSPLVARPYDLRHGGVSLWFNAGVPAPEVARRAGHGVDVLLKVYAGCIDGAEGLANSRIEKALAA
jgi:integrase